ncbi:MAG: hypothetical protein IKZ82_10055 [Clostridia bacterium]|nr:hypothetical protein [Clostridia bacterium]
MELLKRILDFIKEWWRSALVALLVLTFPLTSCYACGLAFAACIKIEEEREARGAYDEVHHSFDEMFKSRYSHMTIADCLRSYYGLSLPESAEFIYGRKHSFWRSSETFFMFRLRPRDIEGYSEGMTARQIMRLIADESFDYSDFDGDWYRSGYVSRHTAYVMGCDGYYDPAPDAVNPEYPVWVPSLHTVRDSERYMPVNGTAASALERETMNKAPKYDGEELCFYHYASSSQAFWCRLYCTKADENEMVFAFCRQWG